MNTIVTLERDGKMQSAIGFYTEFDAVKAFALIIGPSSLHESGEMFQFCYGNLVQYLYNEERCIDNWYETRSSEAKFDLQEVCIASFGGITVPEDRSFHHIPEVEMFLMSRLASSNHVVYYVRPGVNLMGNARIVISRDQIPILVSPLEVMERPRGKRKQKHVSKPNPA